MVVIYRCVDIVITNVDLGGVIWVWECVILIDGIIEDMDEYRGKILVIYFFYVILCFLWSIVGIL